MFQPLTVRESQYGCYTYLGKEIQPYDILIKM